MFVCSVRIGGLCFECIQIERNQWSHIDLIPFCLYTVYVRTYLSFFKSLEWQSSKKWFTGFWCVHLIRLLWFFFDAIYRAIWFRMWETSSRKFGFKMLGKAFDKTFHKIRMWCGHLHIARQICVYIMYTGFGKIGCWCSCMSFTAKIVIVQNDSLIPTNGKKKN